MFFIERKFIIGSVLSVGLLLQPVVLSKSVKAQDDEPLADFSMDEYESQPQAEGAITSEEQGSIEGTVQDSFTTNAETPVEQPSPEGLTPLATETTIGQIEADPEPGLTPVPHSGQYFDSDTIVPRASLRSSVGPREIDPKYEPGSSFVVVRKGAGPDSMQARLVSAQRALKLGRYTSALELYEQLYKQSPKDQNILMGLAVSQQYSGFTESAIATYEELLAIDSKNTNAMVNMLGLLKTQYPSVAYRKLQDLWESNAGNPVLAAQLGLTSAAVGNTQDAMRYLGIAATLEPNNASHYYNMAVVSDQAGANKDAVELYEKALEVDSAYGANRSIPRDQIYDRLANLRRL